MQRLVKLGMLAAALGGGAMYFKGLTPAQMGQVLQQAANQTMQQGQASPNYNQPGYNGNGPIGLPAGNPNTPVANLPPSTRSTIRIASFNIQVFGDSKGGKPHVMAYLGAIVKNFDVVAIQEIRTKDAYFIDNWLRDYVNTGGRQYRSVVGPRLGRSVSKEQYAYVYDATSIELNPKVVFTVQDSPQDFMHREPHVAMFRARAAPPQQAFTFMLANVHTDPDETDTELDALAQVYQSIRRHPIGEDDVIMLGDFNTNVPSSEPYATKRSGRSLVPSDLRALGAIPGIYPLIRDRSTNAAASRLHDNLLIYRGATTEFTGRAGVFDIVREYNLTREQADDLSDHLPVWGEFSVYEGAVPGRMASGPGTPTR